MLIAAQNGRNVSTRDVVASHAEPLYNICIISMLKAAWNSWKRLFMLVLINVNAFFPLLLSPSFFLPLPLFLSLSLSLPSPLPPSLLPSSLDSSMSTLSVRRCLQTLCVWVLDLFLPESRDPVFFLWVCQTKQLGSFLSTPRWVGRMK